MNKLISGISLCLFSAWAMAGEKVDQILDAKSDGYVVIEHLNGFAKITGWSKNQVRVVGELGDHTRKFIFERDGNEVEIKVKTKGSNGRNWGSDQGDELEIFVPYDSQVEYTSVNANVEISDIRGGADIDTVNGNIEAIALAGRLRIEAVNGDITTTDLSGSIKIETVNGDINDRDSKAPEVIYQSINGDINVQTTSPQVRVETVNGDVELQLDKVEQLSMESVNGELDAAMELVSNGYLKATSVGGTVNLRFQKELSARFELKGHAGGRIVNKITDDREQKAKYGPSRWLDFSVNGGRSKVNVSTVSGKIKVDYK